MRRRGTMTYEQALEQLHHDDVHPGRTCKSCPREVLQALNAPRRRPCSLCGHPQHAHDHWRPGADCNLCECEAFQGRGIALLSRIFGIK